MLDQQVVGGSTEQRIPRDCRTGRLQPCERGLVDDERQLHAANIGGVRCRQQAGVTKGAKRSGNRFGEHDPAIGRHGRLLLVGNLVGRREMVRRQVFGKIENRVQRLAIMPGITRLPQQALNIEPLEEEKFHIPARQYQ